MRHSAIAVGALVLASVILALTGFAIGGQPFTPGGRYSDSVTSHLPAADFLRRSLLEASQFPEWRETTMAGHPFAANPLNKTAYPPQWLALVLPPAQHLNLMAIGHLLIAGLGMASWLRVQGLRPQAVVIGAFIYALSPRAIAHLGAGHLDVVYALAWMPWLLWAADRFVRGDRPAIVRVGGLVLTAALIVIADLRVSLFAGALTSAYLLALAVTVRRLPRLLLAPVALIGVLTLTSGVIVPLVAWSGDLTRADLTAGDAGVFALDPAAFIGLLLPPPTGNVETLTYLGLPVVLLMAVGIASRPPLLAFWLVALTLAGLYALGSAGGVWSLLVEVAPPLRWFRVPARAWLIVVLSASLLAAWGVDHLLAGWRPRRSLVVGGAAFLTIIGLAALTALPLPSGSGATLILVGVAGAALLLLPHARSRRVLGGVLLVIAAADAGLFAPRWLEWRDEAAWLTPTQRSIAQTLIDDGAVRVFSPTYSVEQVTAQAYGIALFGGVDPFQVRLVARAIRDAAGIDDDRYSVVLPPLTGIVGDDPATANRDRVIDTAILSAWGVTHVISAYPIAAPDLTSIATVDNTVIYRYTGSVPAQLADHPRWVCDEDPLCAALADRGVLTLATWWVTMLGFGIVGTGVLTAAGVSEWRRSRRTTATNETMKVQHR